MDMNQHMASSDELDAFHSHGFAKIQNGGRVGSISKMTFAERQQIDKNRRLVYGYQRSAIANSYGSFRNKSSHLSNPNLTSKPKTRQEFNAQKQSGVPPKPYNPFA